MHKSEMVFKTLKETRLIALLAPITVEQCVIAYETLAPLGIVLEIAFRTDTALAGIEATLEKHPDALILAGTVMTKKQAETAIHAGVAGIVSADYISAVVDYAVSHNIMCVPGGLSDVGKQLVQKAALYQCELEELREKYPYQWIYKIFPAMTKEIKFIELAAAWKGPFKNLQLVYTGGISKHNLSEIVQIDPDGIYCGSALTKAIDNPAQMKIEATEWLSIIKNTVNKKKI